MKRLIRTLTAALAIGTLCGAIPAFAADIYVNGKVYTADPGLENATAFVVEDGVFVHVGDDESALAWRKDDAKDTVTDLQGARVLPGFIESHTHMTSGGAGAPVEDALYCDGFKTRELLFQKGKEFAEKRPDLPYLGLREVPQEFSGLTMKDWDEICSDRPVFVLFEGGHAGAVNTMMAEKIDLEHQKDPVPGVSYVARDADGHATGYMVELILTHMMCAKGIPLDREQALKGIERMVHFYNSMGYTGITEGGTPNLNENEILPILKELDDAGKYTLHNDFASIWFGHNICSADELESRIKFQKANFETANIKIGTIKMWADGVLGAHSALMRERYNEPSGATNYGSRLSTMDDQLIATRLCQKNGWNMHIHAIGDKCVDDALDVFEMAGEMEGVRSLAHVEICDEDLLDRAAQMGIPIATTPWWCTTQQTSELEGAGRKVDRMIDIAGMVERGICVSFGSDSNGSPGFWNPIVNIYVAVAREPNAPADGAWLPGRPITIQQAIDASTINAARERGHEDEFGSISVGKSADFVIWNKDLMAIAPDEMLTYHMETSSFDMHVWPLKTFFRGRCVFAKQ